MLQGEKKEKIAKIWDLERDQKREDEVAKKKGPRTWKIHYKGAPPRHRVYAPTKKRHPSWQCSARWEHVGERFQLGENLKDGTVSRHGHGNKNWPHVFYSRL